MSKNIVKIKQVGIPIKDAMDLYLWIFKKAIKDCHCDTCKAYEESSKALKKLIDTVKK